MCMGRKSPQDKDWRNCVMKEYKDMTPEEQAEFMEAMTEADRIWDEWKKNGKPPTLKESLLHYEQDHRIC